jgi:hypothetical protein
MYTLKTEGICKIKIMRNSTQKLIHTSALPQSLNPLDWSYSFLPIIIFANINTTKYKHTFMEGG